MWCSRPWARADDERADVCHVVAPELVGAVGQAGGGRVVARAHQQRGGVDRPGCHHVPVGLDGERVTVGYSLDAGDGPRGPICRDASHLGTGQQLHCPRSQRRAHGAHVRIALGVDHAGVRVARAAQDAATTGAPIDGLRQRERVQPLSGEAGRDLGDRSLVGQRRERVVTRVGWLGRVSVPSMNPVELLRLAVPGIHRRVVDRPRGRHAVEESNFAEVGLAEARHRRAVELAGAADVVVGAGNEFIARVGVDPFGRVLVATEFVNRARRPVLALAGEEVALLDDQHVRATVAQRPRERRAPDARADDRDVALDHAPTVDVDHAGRTIGEHGVRHDEPPVRLRGPLRAWSGRRSRRRPVAPECPSA